MESVPVGLVRISSNFNYFLCCTFTERTTFGSMAQRCSHPPLLSKPARDVNIVQPNETQQVQMCNSMYTSSVKTVLKIKTPEYL